MVEFKLDKHDFDLSNVVYDISVNFKDHICKTCHDNLKNSHILAEAETCYTSWKFFAPPPPPLDLKKFDRLERILISQRILLKKVAIMPKG